MDPIPESKPVKFHYEFEHELIEDQLDPKYYKTVKSITTSILETTSDFIMNTEISVLFHKIVKLVKDVKEFDGNEKLILVKDVLKAIIDRTDFGGNYQASAILLTPNLVDYLIKVDPNDSESIVLVEHDSPGLCSQRLILCLQQCLIKKNQNEQIKINKEEEQEIRNEESLELKALETQYKSELKKLNEWYSNNRKEKSKYKQQVKELREKYKQDRNNLIAKHNGRKETTKTDKNEIREKYKTERRNMKVRHKQEISELKSRRLPKKEYKQQLTEIIVRQKVEIQNMESLYKVLLA